MLHKTFLLYDFSNSFRDEDIRSLVSEEEMNIKLVTGNGNVKVVFEDFNLSVENLLFSRVVYKMLEQLGGNMNSHLAFLKENGGIPGTVPEKTEIIPISSPFWPAFLLVLTFIELAPKNPNLTLMPLVDHIPLSAIDSLMKALPTDYDLQNKTLLTYDLSELDARKYGMQVASVDRLTKRFLSFLYDYEFGDLIVSSSKHPKTVLMRSQNQSIGVEGDIEDNEAVSVLNDALANAIDEIDRLEGASRELNEVLGVDANIRRPVQNIEVLPEEELPHSSNCEPPTDPSRLPRADKNHLTLEHISQSESHSKGYRGTIDDGLSKEQLKRLHPRGWMPDTLDDRITLAPKSKIMLSREQIESDILMMESLIRMESARNYGPLRGSGHLSVKYHKFQYPLSKDFLNEIVKALLNEATSTNYEEMCREAEKMNLCLSLDDVSWVKMNKGEFIDCLKGLDFSLYKFKELLITSTLGNLKSIHQHFIYSVSYGLDQTILSEKALGGLSQTRDPFWYNKSVYDCLERLIDRYNSKEECINVISVFLNDILTLPKWFIQAIKHRGKPSSTLLYHWERVYAPQTPGPLASKLGEYIVTHSDLLSMHQDLTLEPTQQFLPESYAYRDDWFMEITIWKSLEEKIGESLNPPLLRDITNLWDAKETEYTLEEMWLRADPPAHQAYFCKSLGLAFSLVKIVTDFSSRCRKTRIVLVDNGIAQLYLENLMALGKLKSALNECIGIDMNHMLEEEREKIRELYQLIDFMLQSQPLNFGLTFMDTVPFIGILRLISNHF